MNVDDIFAQFGNFWDRISAPILFHFIFCLLFAFIFGRLYLKKSIEEYIQSEGFNKTKIILTEFELWKKLPIILLILTCVYLTLFNNIAAIVGSTELFPLNFTYSNELFLTEYEPKDNIVEIARYGKDTIPDLFKIDQLKQKLLEEYKGKYPSNYESWVKWTQDELSSRIRTFHLAILTIASLAIVLIVRLFKKKSKKKLQSLFKYCIVFVTALPILFLLRYRAEQGIEVNFSNEITFLQSSLEIDISRRVTFDSIQVVALDKKVRSELNGHIRQPQIWISRTVGRSNVLQKILGQRKLKNIASRNSDWTEYK